MVEVPIIWSIPFNVIAGKAVVLLIAIAVGVCVTKVVVAFAKRSFDAVNLPQASIFLNLIRVGIWSVVVLFVLEPVFGVSPYGIVTALGVSSLFISLGMRDTVANVVGGLSLMLTRVVIPGDLVEISGVSGEVIDIDLRSTTVRDVQGNIQVIPNSVLNTSTLKRLAPGSLCSFTLALTVDPRTSFKNIEQEIISTLSSVFKNELYVTSTSNQNETGDLPAENSNHNEQEKLFSLKNTIKKSEFVQRHMSKPSGNDAPIQISATSVSKDSIQISVLIRLKEDMDIVSANDAAIQALVGKTWLK